MMMSDDDTAQDDSHSNRTRYRREDCRDEHSRRLRCTCFVPDVQVLSGCGLIAVAQTFYSPATFCETKAGCPPACGESLVLRRFTQGVRPVGEHAYETRMPRQSGFCSGRMSRRWCVSTSLLGWIICCALDVALALPATEAAAQQCTHIPQGSGETVQGYLSLSEG